MKIVGRKKRNHVYKKRNRYKNEAGCSKVNRELLKKATVYRI